MTRSVENWTHAAEDAITYLGVRKREYPKGKMLAVIDQLCIKGTVMRSKLIDDFVDKVLVETAIGHVTTAVHGKGKVPNLGGWYRTTDNYKIYHVEPEFSKAWILKRRLKL